MTSHTTLPIVLPPRGLDRPPASLLIDMREIWLAALDRFRMVTSLSACTIIAGNYLPFARVLAESFFAHHPDGSFTVLVIDDEQRELQRREITSIDWRRLSDIGLDPHEIHRLAGIYDVTELSTAVKPLFLRRLLRRRPERR